MCFVHGFLLLENASSTCVPHPRCKYSLLTSNYPAYSPFLDSVLIFYLDEHTVEAGFLYLLDVCSFLLF